MTINVLIFRADAGEIVFPCLTEALKHCLDKNTKLKMSLEKWGNGTFDSERFISKAMGEIEKQE